MTQAIYRNRNRLWWAALAAIALGWGANNWLGRGLAGEDDSSIEHAKALSRAFRRAAEVAVPTVVTIRTTSSAASTGDEGSLPDALRDYLKQLPEELRKQFEDQIRQQPQTGAGSGVIIDSKRGIILTNNHVLEGADEVLVRLSDGREFKADKADIKVDSRTDLAILRISGADDLPEARMGDSDAMQIGDWVIAVGSPFELESTVSAGIISNRQRELGRGQRTSYLQTDAAINPGNSGGALVNLEGEVVGINTAIATENGAFQGVGFAIPINVAKRVTRQLIERGSVERAYLGVAIDEVNGDEAQKLGLHRGEGVLVGRVQPGSPAAEAGIEEGDIITHFGGKTMHGPRELQDNVEVCPIGSKQELRILRDGKELSLRVTCASLPEDFGAVPRESRPRPGVEPGTSPNIADLGFAVSELSDDDAKDLGLEGKSGVLVSDMDEEGIAYKRGLRKGMLIQRVGRTAVSSVEEFEDALSKQSLARGLRLEIFYRGREKVFVLGAE